jgi:hypothetical protein
MRGNNRQIQKYRIEDKAIRRIDDFPVSKSRRIKNPQPTHIGLRVPIIELLAYKAASTGRSISGFGWGGDA